jgi:hypothetical protein
MHFNSMQKQRFTAKQDSSESKYYTGEGCGSRQRNLKYPFQRVFYQESNWNVESLENKSM